MANLQARDFLAPSAYCVHGSFQPPGGNVCVCDEGWENDVLLLRVNHCNTIANYGLVADWMAIATSSICICISVLWLVRGQSGRPWKARTAMWLAFFASVSGLFVPVTHLIVGSPSWTFWFAASALIVNTYGAINLVNDIFFDILRRDLGKRQTFTLKTTVFRQGSLVLGFVLSIMLYLALVIVYGIYEQEPRETNRATGVIFLLQPIPTLVSLTILLTLRELIQVLDNTDGSDLIRSTRLKITKFRRVFIQTLISATIADVIMGAMAVTEGGQLWAWIFYPVIVIVTPTVGISSVVVTFPLKQARNTSSKQQDQGSSRKSTSKMAMVAHHNDGGGDTKEKGSRINVASEQTSKVEYTSKTEE